MFAPILASWLSGLALVGQAPNVPGPGPGPDPAARAVAPFVSEGVAGVVHIDLAGLDVQALAARVLARLGGESDRAEAALAARELAGYAEALKAAGTRHLFLLLDPQDLGTGPPVLVVPVAEGADAAAIMKVLQGPGPGRSPWAVADAVRGAVVAGSPAAIERVRGAKAVDRPELTAAMAAVRAPFRVVVAPGADLRRILEESLPMLPEELGGGPMTGVTRDMSWAALALETAGEAPRLAVTVQGRDAEAAARLAKIARGGLDLLRKLIDSGPPDAKALAPFLAALAPEAQDDRVVVALPLDRLTDMAAEPLRSARVAARRMQGMNNLKQIALGMHIYADAMSQGGKPAFPPAFRAGKDGKPLLSWRVLILPYIDQKPLYDEFHLDEPWDSPHNKALIARMPAVFRSPAQSGPPGDGKTVYLVPRGASTMFPGAKGVALAEILDGTSNTIMVVEAAPDRAVEWTRPDDWDTGPGKVPTADFPFGAYSEGTNVAFADGAVRFLARTIDAKTLPHLLTRSGGEVVDFSKF